MPAKNPPEADWLKLLQASDLARDLDQQERVHRSEMRRLLLDFLEVLDTVDRLLAQGQPVAPETLALLRRQFAAAFERGGVTFLSSAGQHFDPERQVAVETRPAPGLEPGTVIAEARSGCEWREELLRAAQVVVAG
jgi:molecular chaperone GrpE (heat shock protein)